MPSRYELVLFDQTIEELKKLVSRGKGEESAAAKAALKLLETQQFSTIRTSGFVDDAIVAISKEPDVYVATMDRAVRSKCSRTVLLRQKSHLVVRGSPAIPLQQGHENAGSGTGAAKAKEARQGAKG